MLLNLFLMSDETISDLLVAGAVLVNVLFAINIFYHIFKNKK